MESLLSLSFDNISSRDTAKIRKGIKQIEGLLAQICLSKGSSRSPHKRKSSVLSDKQQHEQASPMKLGELKQDAAFHEFFRLQEGFQWNVTSRLIATLECLMGMGNPAHTDLLILAALDLLQGILLLHPPSRSLFTRETSMNLLLDLLDASNPPRVQSQTLLVLVAVLLDCPANTRVFEAVDGLLTVTSLFKSRATAKEVRMRSMEFVYFYLMPEAAARQSVSAPSTAAMLPRSPSRHLHGALAGHARTHSGDGGGLTDMDIDDEEEVDFAVRSTDEKQRLLARYLPNAADIAQDLQNSAPFGVVASC